MITSIREVRRAKGLTLDDVARACVPPTTAQTIGRLEMGTRTVSVAWLNRIAAALGVEAADLVRLPDRSDLPVVAVLNGGMAAAPRHASVVTCPRIDAGMVAITVAGATGDYRAGDQLWCAMLTPDQFAQAMNRDVLAPMPGGGFLFGRLVALAPPTLLPANDGLRPIQPPAWLALPVRLVRSL